MIKHKEIYPKTKRISNAGNLFEVTEKLDGSNLVFYRQNEKLYIALRRNIFCLSELEDVKDILYKGLYEFLKEHGDFLEQSIHEGSAVCGEWLGMGAVKYDVKDFPLKYYMFAKARITEDLKLYNFDYYIEDFHWVFKEGEIPEFIGTVPHVCSLARVPNKEILDSIYEAYEPDRKVEGFVINYNNMIKKYVRMSNGKLVDYNENDRKGE